MKEPEIRVRPSRILEFLLRRMVPENEDFEKMGDFEEGFRFMEGEYGRRAARRWYRRQVLRMIPLTLRNLLLWRLTMLKNYIRIAFRNIQRHKGYALINITGLALGMACCILILLWVQDELSTNTFHDKIAHLYIARTIQHYGSETQVGIGSVPALGPALREEYPEILNAARFSNGQGEYLLEHEDRQFRWRIQLADPEIFQLFTFPLLKGRVDDLFGDPFVMVLSESAARAMFGNEDPMGKILSLDKRDEFRVAGVMRDIPHNSSIRFDIWAPLELTTRWNRPNYISTWSNMAFRTYLEAVPGIDVEAFNKKIFGRIRESDPETILEPLIYPFGQMYLHLYGRLEAIRAFSIIAVVILIIACINFMSLSTARSAHRAREVGLRKVVGAQRQHVMRQFFGESLVFTLIALALAVGVVVLLMPAFGSLTGKPLRIGALWDGTVMLGILGVALGTGLLAGSYPALFLSAFRPVSVLQGGRDRRSGGGRFRKLLVILQFAASVVLILCTVVILRQVQYMKGKNLGFDREHLLYVRLEDQMRKQVDSIKHELTRFPGVRSVSATSHSPTGVYNNGQDWDWEGRDPNVNPLVTYFGVDPDFLETFKMELAAGESFRPGPGGGEDSVLINQRFADIMGRPDVIGLRISQGRRVLRIIGVVRDFFFTPVNREIGPAILYFDPTYQTVQRYRYLFIRVNPGDIPATLSHVEKTVKSFNPGFPFEYRFLDDDYDRLYRGVEREMSIVRTFTLLAVLVSCLGLFGLAAYTAEQRTKEIGVRKILGSSTMGIMILLSRQYFIWIGIANLVAWPVAYYLMRGWLQDYAHRIPLSWTLFVLSGALSLLIAQLTVGYQSLKAARSNPVDSLRYE